MRIGILSSRVLKNASWIIVSRVIQSVLILIVGMMTARYLGPSNYGLITYASSIASFILPITQLGLNNIIVQEIVADENCEGEVLGTALTVSSISAVLCIAGITFFTTVTNTDNKETMLVCILYSIVLVFQALEMIQYWFQAKLLSKYTSVISLVAYVVVSAYKIFLLATNKSIYWFALSNAIDYMLIAIALLCIYKRLNGHPLKFSFSQAKRLLKKSCPYIPSALMVTVFAQTDRIMIKHMVGDVAIGYYSAATSCVSIVSFVYTAVIDSVRPTLFAQQKSSKQRFEEGISKLYGIIACMCITQGIVETIFAPLLIRILYGDAYLPAVSTLRIVVWFLPFSYFGAVRNIWILAEGKQRYLWIINLLGALSNVVLNGIMIPRWGANGAAIASVITQFFTNVIVGFIVKPIRYNNTLMLKGLDPRLIVVSIKSRRNNYSG